jgi:hypothetical protein
MTSARMTLVNIATPSTIPVIGQPLRFAPGIRA